MSTTTSIDTLTGAGPIRAAHRFDVDRLRDYLRREVDESIRAIEVTQFSGGQSNPTYLVQAGDSRYVLRRKPPGTLLPSAHAVDREYRAMTALARTDVPVPKTCALCMDDSVIGTAFFIMQYVECRIFHDPRLPGVAPQERGALFDEMNRVIAVLHRVDHEAVGLADYGKSGSYFSRQIDRWTKQYRAAETEKIEAMENLIAWLPQHIPADDKTRIVHGDYRIDNVVYHPSEPRILAVLDWELSTLGHPLADFSYHCMTWHLAPGQFRGIAGEDIKALGIPDERAYIAAYCRRVGQPQIAEQEWAYYMAFGMFRLAGILQGVLARALQGNASSQTAMETGLRAKPLAEAAWQQVETLLRRGA